MERERLLNGEIDYESEQVNEAGTAPTVTLAKPEVQVNLEGGDWLLTTLLITLDAILLAIYQCEDTKWATFLTWFHQQDCDSGWSCDLVATLFIMAVAIVNVTLLIPIINVNVRTPSKTYWRFWVFIAWLSMGLVDTMTILQVVDSIRKCVNGDDEDIESWAAHFCLVISAVVATLLLNIRFLYLYRLHSCFTCSEDETLQNTPGLVQIYNREHGIHERVHADRTLHQSTASHHLRVFRTAPKLTRFDTKKFVEDVGKGLGHIVMRKTRFGRQGNFRLGRMLSRQADRSFVARLRQSMVASKMHHAKCYLGNRISEAYHQVAEVDNVFEYSTWMKSAALFTVLMLIYNCIKTTEVFFKLASAWDDYHQMAKEFEAGMRNVSASLDGLNQNLTTVSESVSAASADPSVVASINSTLPEALAEVQSLQDTLSTFEQDRGKAYDLAGTMLDLALLTTAKLVNITDLKESSVVGAFFYVDSIIPIIKYTCMVGYPIGTFIGLNSLYQVLVQHKQMSLGLEQALTARTSTLFGRALDDEDAKLSLLGIEKKYQIGGAVYFFGILMSTAVVQQHIFGFLATMLLAIVVDIKNFDVLLNIGGYILFVYLAVLITNLFVTHVIGDRFLTKGGFQIRHPWTFFLYLFTFSMVHAVLGFLYALWRALLLLITTFWVLNRLDVSLFLAGKQLDNGHYSFMSMLLLTRVIKLTNISQGYIHTSSDVVQGTPEPPPPPPTRPTPTRPKKERKTVAFSVPEDSTEDQTEEINSPEEPGLVVENDEQGAPEVVEQMSERPEERQEGTNRTEE